VIYFSGISIAVIKIGKDPAIDERPFIHKAGDKFIKLKAAYSLNYTI